MSSQAKANSLLAALEEADKNPTLGFHQSFTLHGLGVQSPPSTNSRQASSPKDDPEVQIISSNSSDDPIFPSTQSRPSSSLHLSPKTYERKHSKAIPKKSPPAASLSPPDSSQNPTRSDRHDVKLHLLKAGGGDNHVHSSWGNQMPGNQTGSTNSQWIDCAEKGRGRGRGQGRGRGRARGGAATNDCYRGRSRRGNATGLNMLQPQTSPHSTPKSSNLADSRKWVFTQSTPGSGASGSGVERPLCMMTMPHNATIAPKPSSSESGSNVVSSSSVAVNNSNGMNRAGNGSNSGGSQHLPVREDSKIKIIRSGAVSTTGTQNLLSEPQNTEGKGMDAASVSAEESDSSSQTSEAEVKADSGSPQDALCSNCGIWSENEHFCPSCGKDFKIHPPKKYREKKKKGPIIVVTRRPTYRSPTKKEAASTSGSSPGNKTGDKSPAKAPSLRVIPQPGIAQSSTVPKKLVGIKPAPVAANRTGETPLFIVTSPAKGLQVKTFYVNKLTDMGASMGPNAVFRNPVTNATTTILNTKLTKEGNQTSRKRPLRGGSLRGVGSKRPPLKPKEPEIVLISDSDEDEEANASQQQSMPASEGSQEEEAQETSPSHTSRKAKMRDQSGNLIDTPSKPPGDISDGPSSFDPLNPGDLKVAFNVVSLRFGSWPKQCAGSQIRLPPVGMTPDGFQFHFMQECHKCGKIELSLKDIVKCEHYINSGGMTSFFITTAPCFAGVIRSRLNMARQDEHFDPMSKKDCEKLLVIRPMEEQFTKATFERVNKVLAAMATKSSSTDGLKFQPIDKARTNALLVSSTRPDLRHKVIIATQSGSINPSAVVTMADCPASMTLRNLTRLQSGQTGPSPAKTDAKDRRSTSSEDQLDNRLFVYPPPPKFGGITVTPQDLECLEDGEFLNDVIIDFYLKYVMENLSEFDQQRTHLFSCFFYKRLMQQETRGTISPELNGLTPKEKRHQKVRKWTRHVDIFDKDFIIIPINDCAHWFVAVICFARNVNTNKDKSESQSPSPVSSSQPSSAAPSPAVPSSQPSSAAPSPAVPSPGTPLQAAPSPAASSPGTPLQAAPSPSSATPSTGAPPSPAMPSPAAPSPTPSDQPTNHGTPGVQTSRSHSEQPGQAASDDSVLGNVNGNRENDGPLLANRGGGSVNGSEEEEPMDTSESPDERFEDQGSEKAENAREAENGPRDNLSGQSSANETEATSTPSKSAATEMETSTSAISSSSSSPTPTAGKSNPATQTVSTSATITFQPAKVNGSSSKKGDILDFDYQAYHVGEHKRFKQPCILIFDSLAGAPRRNVIAKLRDYLTIEWEKRKEGKCEFTTANMRGMSPKVPQQTNFSDCGIYVCQYMESFFERPITNYRCPMRGLHKWFSEDTVSKKRQEIRTLIKNLAEEYKARR